MSVDIKCLYRPPFLQRSYTQWPPFFLQSTPNDPFFNSRVKFYIQIANFRVLRTHFEKFINFVVTLTKTFEIFGLKLHFCTLNDPHFGSPHQKRPLFWCPHRITPFFLRNPTPWPNAPYFRSPLGTCTSLSYSSAHHTGSGVPPQGCSCVYKYAIIVCNCLDTLTLRSGVDKTV